MLDHKQHCHVALACWEIMRLYNEEASIQVYCFDGEHLKYVTVAVHNRFIGLLSHSQYNLMKTEKK